MTRVIQMRDKVERVAAAITAQQQKIGNPAEQFLRFQTAPWIGFAQGGNPK